MRLRGELEEKSRALDLIIPENEQLRMEMQSLEERLKAVEYDSKTLIDRWMSQKMIDAERLNEVSITHLHQFSERSGRYLEFAYTYSYHMDLTHIRIV